MAAGIEQGVALTVRNTTGPPSRVAPWLVTLHMRRRGVLQTTTDDDNRRQRASLVWDTGGTQEITQLSF